MRAMRRAPTLLLLCVLGCSPGGDGAWTALEDGLLPLELRLVRTGTEGWVWAAGYHSGALSGALVQGTNGVIGSASPPDDLLWDYAFVDMDVLEPDVVWLAGTAHVFRYQQRIWEVHGVPADVTDGVTASSFPGDGIGWIAAQGWDGAHIYRFEGDEWIEEDLDGETGGVSIVAIEVLADGTGVAAGARTDGALSALLYQRTGERWAEVSLPVPADDLGGIRDVYWHDGGPEIWVVADQMLRGLPGALEVQELPVDADFVARAGASTGGREGWLAGFGSRPVLHWRWGEWEAVPPERLTSGDGAGRTWLVDDMHFASPEEGWMVAGFVDCSVSAECPSGASLMRYDRMDDTQGWTLDADWARPLDDWTAGPSMAVRALALDTSGAAWLCGDAAPDGDLDWNLPQTWRRAPGGVWTQQPALAGIGIHGLTFPGPNAGWAVGSEVDGDDRHQGVVLRWDGATWQREVVDAVTSVDWELFDVAETPGGEVVAVGRRMNYPLVLILADGAWRMLSLDGYIGITAMLSVSVGPDGVVWAAGTSLTAAGTLEGYLVRGDPTSLTQVELPGKECGPPGARYPCWSLAAVAATENGAVAVGESTVVRVDGDQVTSVPTNMTLMDVAVDADGAAWVLAENGWWIPAGDDWTVRRHWDEQASTGVVRRLVAASDGFDVVVGQREWSDGSVQAVVIEP